MGSGGGLEVKEQHRISYMTEVISALQERSIYALPGLLRDPISGLLLPGNLLV
jgi:hypothetical protein